VAEWRDINSTLLRKLSEAIDSPNTKKLIYDVFGLRNEFQSVWRASESELVQLQQELIRCAERGDFVRAATLSIQLITLKARVQAAQAAHHELDLLIRRSKVVRPHGEASDDAATVASTLTLLDQVEDRESAAVSLRPQRIAVGAGKIIPLKRV
jgi:hypothetical protein